MESIRFLPIPADDYDALGIGANTVLQTHLTEDGALIIRAVGGDELESFACDGDCDGCPVSETECGGDCFSCPCYANCDDSNYRQPEVNAFPEGVCKSHGNRRDKFYEERY